MFLRSETCQKQCKPGVNKTSLTKGKLWSTDFCREPSLHFSNPGSGIRCVILASAALYPTSIFSEIASGYLGSWDGRAPPLRGNGTLSGCRRPNLGLGRSTPGRSGAARAPGGRGWGARARVSFQGLSAPCRRQVGPGNPLCSGPLAALLQFLSSWGLCWAPCRWWPTAARNSLRLPYLYRDCL